MILSFKFQSKTQQAGEKTGEKNNFHDCPVCLCNMAVETCLLKPAKVKKKLSFFLSSQLGFLSGLAGTLLSTHPHRAPITINRRHLQGDWRRPVSMFLSNFRGIKIFLFFFLMRKNEVITACVMKLIRKTQPQSKKKRKRQKGGYSFHCSKAAIEQIVHLHQCSNRCQLLRFKLKVM